MIERFHPRVRVAARSLFLRYGVKLGGKQHPHKDIAGHFLQNLISKVATDIALDTQRPSGDVVVPEDVPNGILLCMCEEGMQEFYLPIEEKMLCFGIAAHTLLTPGVCVSLETAKELTKGIFQLREVLINAPDPRTLDLGLMWVICEDLLRCESVSGKPYVNTIMTDITHWSKSDFLHTLSKG